MDGMASRALLPLLLLATAAPPASPVAVKFDFPLQPPTISDLNVVPDFAQVNGSIVELPPTMYFPDDNGDPAPGKIRGGASFAPSEVMDQDVFFTLFTRRGPTEGEVIYPGDVNSLEHSSFNASEHTLIVTHGFLQSIRSNTIQSIKDMYISYKGGNLIAVDWSRISKNWLYYIVKVQTVQVGQMVGAFVAFLAREAGIDVSKVHLCGHSLGAHVVGVAGKSIRIAVGKKAGRITGLDPAGPLYSVLDRTHRLDRGDADFVDVIHTCGGWLGMSAPIGHADFFPNGGTMRQPGCSLDFVTAGVCSHSRSWELFAESINTQAFASRPCATYVDYLRDNCPQGSPAPMGLHVPKSISGNYYLNTADFSPYAMG